MSSEPLSQYFDGITFKRLSAVEADPARSNQHEFDGTKPLKRLLGADRQELPARFVYLSDTLDEPIVADGSVTWYDARENHPTRSEYRLYYPRNRASLAAAEGDLLVMAKRPDGSLFLIIAQALSTAENQIRLLFDLPVAPQQAMEFKSMGAAETLLSISRSVVLELLGVEVGRPDDSELSRLVRRFPAGFPSTREFSAFARESTQGVAATEDPDGALLAWWKREEQLFRVLERHIVADRLRRGFGDDVDSFIDYSLSVHQTRKSRAGHALENHFEQLLSDHSIRYSRGQITENRARPDFVFPGILEYRTEAFRSDRLTILGVKSTCKDRWRQVLSEAARVQSKHLLTLEPSISEAQTNEMRDHALQLVVPAAIHDSFLPGQQRWLMSVRDFIALVAARQG